MPLFEWPALGWLALAVLSAIVEVSIPHFGLVFVALGAVGAAAAAALSLTLPVQIVVFCVVLTVSVLALRPRLVARLDSRGVPSRTEQLTGKDGIVTHDIDPTTGAGRVNVGGEDWAARSSERIPAGTPVRVVGADGIVLEVRRS
jgi:membrane protein implicated in regulation of membrane protease activity